jgi:nucleotide-binding universal stress UspA family protein
MEIAMYKNILIPVLFDDGHDTNASFVAARALAGQDAKFTMLHVMETIPNYARLEILESAIEDSRKQIAVKLSELVMAIPSATPVLINGHPGRSIVDYANANKIDCIVMASHQLGLSDIFIGSTAAKVVRHAKCSVHVIR